jgi:hypothetical protein
MLVYLLFALLPSLVVLAAVVLVLNQQYRRQRQELSSEIRLRAFSQVMPLRLAAYERAMLLCTRMQPDALLLRAQPQGKTAPQLRGQLLDEIRTEYEHNAVQQLYISEAAWEAVLTGRDSLIGAVTSAGETAGESVSGVGLGQALLRQLNEAGGDPFVPAVRLLKSDMQRMLL